MHRVMLLGLISLFSNLLLSTSIIPFNDMTHLTDASHTVVIVKALQEKSLVTGDLSEAIRDFQVLDVLKGSAPMHISIKSGEQRIGDYVNITHGGFDFHQGDVYLLFLDKLEDDTYSPKCMSYYVFQEISKHQKKYFVPRYLKGDLQILKQERESIHHVYDKDSLIKTFRSHDKGDAIDIGLMKAPAAEQSLTAKVLKSSPSHCSYLQSNNGRRYQVEDLGTEPLPIYYQNANSECSTVDKEMRETINYMNDNYEGVQLSLGGSFSGYNSNCNNGRAYDLSYFGGNYDSYVDNKFGTKRVALVQFGDPCNEIPALNNCAGTVAKGGAWAIGNHTADGETFNTAVYGYVIVNEGMGNCNCGDYSSGSPISDFSSIIAHEISHTIGLNHISNATGTANMNPYSGSQITPLDIECVDDLYPPSVTSGNDDGGQAEPGPAAKPDLTVSSCGSVSVNGDAISILGITIKNIGAAPSGGRVTLGYYVSDDANITTDDRLLGKTNLVGIGGGGERQVNKNLNIGQLNLSAGQYHIGLIVDHTGVINESNEGNNVCQHNNAIKIDAAPIEQNEPADLILKDCGTVTVSGNRITINQVKVKNVSKSTPSEFTFIGYYLSADTKITEGDIYLGYDYIPSLSAGGESTENATFDLSQFNLGNGNYYLGIKVDINDSILETNEANNTCYHNSPRVSLQPAASPADLTIDCGTAQITNTQVAFNNISVRNSGGVATNAQSYVAYYLSRDEAISNTDYLLGTRLVPVLSPGASSTLSASFLVGDADLGPGDYYLGVVADYDGRVSEANEANNKCIYQQKLTIAAEPVVIQHPDLIVECGTVSWNNQVLNMSNTIVKNQGKIAANQFSYLAYYLSTDRTITTDDYYLGYDLIERLKVNQSVSKTKIINLRESNIPDGDYFVGYIADFSDNVNESHEGNNSCGTAVAQVSLGDPAGAEPDHLSDGECAEFDYNNFDDGSYGIWADGGKDAFINAGVTFAKSGVRSVAIRGNSGIQSSIYTTRAIRMAGYQSINLSFSVYSFLVERGDAFVLEVDNGSGYQVHERWEAQADFIAGRDISIQTSINSTSNIKLRFRAITSSNFEYFFLDNIRIERCPNRALVDPISESSNTMSSKQMASMQLSVYPSILRQGDKIQVDYTDGNIHTGQVLISDMSGMVVTQRDYNEESKLILNTDQLSQGMHIISIIEQGERRVEKIMIQ